MNQIKKIAGVHSLTEAEQSQLIKQLTPYIQGISFKSDIDAEINGKAINCTWQKMGNKLIINSVKVKAAAIANIGAKNTGKTVTPLDKLIASGDIVKNNNWYTYKGQNYNGKKAINAAING